MERLLASPHSANDAHPAHMHMSQSDRTQVQCSGQIPCTRYARVVFGDRGIDRLNRTERVGPRGAAPRPISFFRRSTRLALSPTPIIGRPTRPVNNRCAERSLPCRPREVKPRGRKRASGESGEKEEPEPEPLLLARQPLLDMVLKQANPKGDAELFLRCFHDVRAGWEGLSACLPDPFIDVPYTLDDHNSSTTRAASCASTCCETCMWAPQPDGRAKCFRPYLGTYLVL